MSERQSSSLSWEKDYDSKSTTNVQEHVSLLSTHDDGVVVVVGGRVNAKNHHHHVNNYHSFSDQAHATHLSPTQRMVQMEKGFSDMSTSDEHKIQEEEVLLRPLNEALSEELFIQHDDDDYEEEEAMNRPGYIVGDDHHPFHEFSEFNDFSAVRSSTTGEQQIPYPSPSSSPMEITPFGNNALHFKKSKKRQTSKNEQKAKLDFQFLKRFFVIIGYCLRVIERNSDYHVLDENGKRIVHQRWWCFKRKTSPLNSEMEKGKFVTFWNNFSIFNWMLVMLFLLVCVGEILLGNEIGKIPGAFYKVIIDASSTKFSDSGPFVKVMLISLLWICGMTIVKTFRQFVLDCVRLFWRRNLTFHLQRRYFEFRNYYNMIVLDKRVDNPDQRITKDAENFVDMTCKFVESLFTGPITVFYYTVTVFLNIGWQGPLCCYAFFIIGSIINKLIISPIANLWFIQEKYEGNFRYAHTQIRSNAESIAFYSGDANERTILNQKLKGTINNRRKIVMWNIMLNGHMNLFGYTGSILAYMIIALSAFVIGNFIDNNESAGNIADKISVVGFLHISKSAHNIFLVLLSSHDAYLWFYDIHSNRFRFIRACGLHCKIGRNERGDG